MLRLLRLAARVEALSPDAPGGLTELWTDDRARETLRSTAAAGFVLARNQGFLLHPEHQQLAVYPAIPPPGIVTDQPQHQGADRAHGPRSARAPGPGPAGMPAREYVAVPAEHGIRVHHPGAGA